MPETPPPKSPAPAPTPPPPSAPLEEPEETGSSAALIGYQDALLEHLSSGPPQDAVLEALKTDPRFAHYHEYIAKFDPDMVAVACELMGKWARRKPTNSNP